jgi:predicted anti-sigma-YlaC factor YlaD
MSNISAVKNSDGSVSSKRVMYVWFSIGLALAGVAVIIIAAALNSVQWWPFAAGGGIVGLGVLHALITGGYIKAQDIAEIATKVQGK